MARPKNLVETRTVTISLPGSMVPTLEQLVRASRGVYGSSVAEASSLLVRDGLQRLLEAEKYGLSMKVEQGPNEIKSVSTQ